VTDDLRFPLAGEVSARRTDARGTPRAVFANLAWPSKSRLPTNFGRKRPLVVLDGTRAKVGRSSPKLIIGIEVLTLKARFVLSGRTIGISSWTEPSKRMSLESRRLPSRHAGARAGTL